MLRPTNDLPKSPEVFIYIPSPLINIDMRDLSSVLEIKENLQEVFLYFYSADAYTDRDYEARYRFLELYDTLQNFLDQCAKYKKI